MSKLTEDIVIQPNYDAQKWLSWFGNDSQNAQNLCSQVFRGGYVNTDPNFIALVNAALNSLTEVQNDLDKLKEFLAIYNTLSHKVEESE